MQRDCKNHQPKLAQVIKLINQYYFSIILTTSTSSMILDPIFISCKACLDDWKILFLGRQFGIILKICDRKWFIQIVTNNKKLCIYSIPVRNKRYVISDQYDILDELLPFIIPWTFRYNTQEDYNRSNNILDYSMLGYTTKKPLFTVTLPLNSQK